MKIPQKVKIGPFWYSIEFARGLKTEKEEELYGLIDHTEQKIKIGEEYPRERKEATFFHEVLHGICEALGADLDEKTITLIATSLYEVMIDCGLIEEGQEENDSGTRISEDNPAS